MAVYKSLFNKLLKNNLKGKGAVTVPLVLANIIIGKADFHHKKIHIRKYGE